MAMQKKEVVQSSICAKHLMGIADTMELLSGKWKIKIIATLMQKGKLRFMDLLREVDGIAAKMLSKELQELELNELVSRTVCDTKPITVEYEITDHGLTLQKTVDEIASWGIAHRKRLFKKEK